MKTLEAGNLWYFFYIAVTVGIFLAVYLPVKNKSEKAKRNAILIIALINFACHFLRMLLPEYQDGYPYTWRKVTFENICTTSVLLFPFIHLSKSKVWKDYIVFMSIIGGVLGVLIPVGAWGFPPFRLESIRYYITHSGLFLQGSLTLAFGVHVPSYKRFWIAPLTFFFVLGLIALNEVVLRAVGLTEQTLEDITRNVTERNSMFIFGPTDMVKEKFGFVLALVPDFMKHGVGARAGEDFYWPWVWMFFPLLLYGEIIAHLMGFTWGWKQVKEDIEKRKTAEKPTVKY